MIHITKAKNGYMGIITGKNGEVLSTTEILTTKENVINNIFAQAGNYVRILFYNVIYCDKFIYQDDTYKVPKIFLCSKETTTNKKSIVQFTAAELKKYKITINTPKYKKQEAKLTRLINTHNEVTGKKVKNKIEKKVVKKEKKIAVKKSVKKAIPKSK
jgi:hypothetical protein